MSATARVTGHSRTTIARWLERAATAAACFNHRLLRDFDVIELQADERCTFIGSKRRTLWLFATIEVCSRLWAGSVLGCRSHRNTKAAINDVILRGRRQERITVSQTQTQTQPQSVFCVAPRRDGAGVRPTDHRRDGRQKTGWTKPQRYPSMGIRSSEAGRGQVSWPGGGPGVGGRSRRWGVGGPPAPVWWMQRAHAS